MLQLVKSTANVIIFLIRKKNAVFLVSSLFDSDCRSKLKRNCVDKNASGIEERIQKIGIVEVK